jgi:hypothetical protein
MLTNLALAQFLQFCPGQYSSLSNSLLYQHTQKTMHAAVQYRLKGGGGGPRYLSLPLYGFSLSGSFIIQQWHHILHMFDNSTQSIKCTTQLTIHVS